MDKQLKPLLIKTNKNGTAYNSSRCNMLDTCPIWLRSEFSLKPTFCIIGNVSETTGIAILNGENDSQVPVQ
ncbi:MAG: hypothetical protein M3044_06985 [Thermoproteota archaeon]|nr:hypothetical protein [Thermoproteota archaeon]